MAVITRDYRTEEWRLVLSEGMWHVKFQSESAGRGRFLNIARRSQSPLIRVRNERTGYGDFMHQNGILK